MLIAELIRVYLFTICLKSKQNDIFQLSLKKFCAFIKVTRVVFLFCLIKPISSLQENYGIEKW